MNPIVPAQPVRGLTASGVLFVVALAGILAGGWSLRHTGIDHGRPHLVYHPDVAKQTLVAARLFRGPLDIPALYGGDFRRALYPYGTAVMLGYGARAAAAIAGSDTLGEVHRWVWALRMRYLASLLFLAATAAACLFMRARFGPLPALLGALFLATEAVIVQYSHYGMNDVPLAALLLLAWAAAGMMPREHRHVPVFSALTGLALGLAFGAKYQAALAGLFPLAAWIGFAERKGMLWLLLSVAGVAAGGLAGMLFACPVLASDPGYFIDTFPDFMRWQANIMGVSLPFHLKLVRNVQEFGLMLWPAGRWVLPVGIVWAALSAGSRRAPDEERLPILAAAVFCAVLTVILLVSRDFVRSNDLVPILAFGAVLLAVPAGRALAAFGDPRWRAGSIAALLLSLGVVSVITENSVADSMALARPDTRERAQRWCIENLPPGARVVRERYTLPTGRDDVTEYRCRYLADSPVEKRVRRKRCDFVITSSLAHARFFDRRSPYYSEQNQAIYGFLRANYERVAVFQDRDLYFAHPVVEIYGAKLRNSRIAP